ncbi:hypothetical protein [Wolbachia endosymbiont (group A) of Therophilus tumidulus]|uniref:hypothetical protein n=1 Tax=Wolbachia endosymbiont (group A) of Therophilus tumidulus TaxID=3066214 RepID=UPI00376EDF6A
MSENFEIDIEIDQQEQVSIAVDHTTLEDTLKLLKSGGLLSDLDNDLHKVRTGERAIIDHRGYFKTQVDSKLKKLCMIYHPDSVRRRDGSEEEVLKATAVQAKINAVRDILWNFSENFSQHDDFKYSYFSKVEINLLSNEKKLRQVSYTLLNKLGELSYTKHGKLIPNLNQFLKSSQNSMREFIAGNFNKFLKKKSNAEFYFREYLYAYKELFTDLKLFYELCKEDNYMKPIATQMLNECSTQGKILTKIDDFLGQSEFQHEMLIKESNLMKCEYPYCINNQEDYQKADKYFTLPFIEYINILAICHKVYSTQEPRHMNSLVSWVLSLKTVCSTLKNSQVICKANNEVIENLNDLLSLHRLSHHLLAYYCYSNEANGESAAKSLHINSLNKEYALQLLVQVINVYSAYLTREFLPEKDFYERILEVQMNFLEKMDSLYNEFYKKMDKHGEQFLKEDLEFHRQINVQGSDRRQLISGLLVRRMERRKATFAKIEKMKNEKISESTKEEQQSKTSCISPSQQFLENQTNNQPAPSCKLDEVHPISRSQSLNSLHSDNSDIKIDSSSRFR